MAQDGKLGDALRKKYRTPKDALKALGLDPSLLDASRLAFDGKRKARDSVLSPDSDGASLAALEKLLAEHLDGEVFQRAQRMIEAAMHEAGVEHDGEVVDEEPADDREEMPDEEKRLFRRWQMKGLADHCIGEKGWSVNDVRTMFEHPDFLPKSGIETGGAGGGALAEDIDWTMEQLEGVGTGGTNIYREMPQSKDRKRRMAKDRQRKLALDRDFNERFPGLSSPRDMSHRYGDREPEPPLALDEQQNAEDYDRANAWFGLDRIKLA